LKAGMKVLEPQAGVGGIADFFPEGSLVTCVEILDDNVLRLAAKGYKVLHGDFLSVEPGSDHGCPGHAMQINADYDVVAMNPPFSVPGDSRADITHVSHAWKFLKPGGRLVSIMSAGVSFRTDRKTLAFLEWVDWHSGEIVANPEGAFEESGTHVNTITLVMDKPS